MADLVQNVNGRWDITSLYHEFSENVEIPVTLKYNNESAITYTISKEKDRRMETPWYTPLGEEIQTNTETALEEGTGITFTSQTVPANAGLCKISKITWLEVTPYIPPVVETYEIEVRPERQTGSTNNSCVDFKAYWVKYVNGTKDSETEITNTAIWNVTSVAGATVDKGTVCFNNTDTASTKEITVTASNEGKSDTGVVVVPKATPVTVYGTLRCTGGTPTGATIRINNVSKGTYTGGTKSYGDYEVGTRISWSATLNGYTSDSGTITIREGYNDFAYELEEITPETKYGTVCVTGSTPTGATVVVGTHTFTYTGGTQCVDEEYVVGTRVTWSAEKDGYTSDNGTVTIVEGTNYISFALSEVEHEFVVSGSTDEMDSCEGTITLGAWYDGTNVTINAGTSWSSSDTNIAIVNNTGVNKGKVTYHNSGETAATVTITATYNGYSSNFEITVPACASVEVDHCEVSTSTSSIELNNGSKTITVSAVTYYTDGTSAYTTPSYHWEKRDGEFEPADEAYIANVATVISASTGNGPYTFTVSVDGVYDITKSGTLVFKSPDCSNESAEVVARCTRIITYPTIYVSSNLDSSYGGMYGFHVVFSNLEASTKNITWKVSINNPIFTVRYTPDPNSSERTDMDSWPSIEFTGYTNETGLIGGYELVDDNLKSDLFPSQYISIGHESGPEEVFLWVKVPQETTLNFATLSNEREINNNVGGKSIGPIK